MRAPRAKLDVLHVSQYDPEKSVAKEGGWPPQAFHVSHLREEDFRNDGLRAFTLSRDLGFAKATNGMVQVHVNRRAHPFNDTVPITRHFHDVNFQMVYVLKGWVRNEFEGHGEHVMRAGSAWLQPPGLRHTLLEYSDDLEILEIIIPAVYPTYNVDEPPGGAGNPIPRMRTYGKLSSEVKGGAAAPPKAQGRTKAKSSAKSGATAAAAKKAGAKAAATKKAGPAGSAKKPAPAQKRAPTAGKRPAGARKPAGKR